MKYYCWFDPDDLETEPIIYRLNDDEIEFTQGDEKWHKSNYESIRALKRDTADNNCILMEEV